MQFPTEFKSNGVYVLFEKTHDVEHHDSFPTVVGIFESKEEAMRNLTPSRMIQGPVPYHRSGNTPNFPKPRTLLTSPPRIPSVPSAPSFGGPSFGGPSFGGGGMARYPTHPVIPTELGYSHSGGSGASGGSDDIV
jgi:hypothetical protein